MWRVKNNGVWEKKTVSRPCRLFQFRKKTVFSRKCACGRIEFIISLAYSDVRPELESRPQIGRLCAAHFTITDGSGKVPEEGSSSGEDQGSSSSSDDDDDEVGEQARGSAPGSDVGANGSDGGTDSGGGAVSGGGTESGSGGGAGGETRRGRGDAGGSEGRGGAAAPRSMMMRTVTYLCLIDARRGRLATPPAATTLARNGSGSAAPAAGEAPLEGRPFAAYARSLPAAFGLPLTWSEARCMRPPACAPACCEARGGIPCHTPVSHAAGMRYGVRTRCAGGIGGAGWHAAVAGACARGAPAPTSAHRGATQPAPIPCSRASAARLCAAPPCRCSAAPPPRLTPRRLGCHRPKSQRSHSAPWKRRRFAWHPACFA